MKNKKQLLQLGLIVLAGTLTLGSRNEPDQTAARVDRGRYLMRFGGCHDCHTPKKMTDRGPVDDESRLLSGHPESPVLPPPPANGDTPWFASTAGLTAWSGPWGISYAANLTPDTNTGLGIWTEDMFIKAMRNGKHMGTGRPILPPMPWENVGKLTDADLKAVYAYLRSIPAIQNHVPTPMGPDGKAFE